MVKVLLMILMLTSGCMMDSFERTKVCFVSEEYLQDTYAKSITLDGLDEEYETWQSLHRSIKDILDGVNSFEGSFFEHYGNWYNTYSDNFAIYDWRDFSISTVCSIQKELRAHHPQSRVVFFEPDGLQILITVEDIYISFEDEESSSNVKRLALKNPLVLELIETLECRSNN